MTGQDDYPYIRVWGRILGTPESRVQEQVELARREDAPADAIYRNEDGTWTTTGYVMSPHTRFQLGLEPLPPVPPDIAIITEEAQSGLFWSARLREQFGLRDVERVGVQVLHMRFSTGYIVELKLELRVQNPGETE